MLFLCGILAAAVLPTHAQRVDASLEQQMAFQSYTAIPPGAWGPSGPGQALEVSPAAELMLQGVDSSTLSVGMHAVHAAMQDEYVRLDFNLTFAGSALPTAPSVNVSGPFVPYHTCWMVAAHVQMPGSTEPAPSSILAFPHANATAVNVSLAGPANVILAVEAKWLPGLPEPGLVCTGAWVSSGGVWSRRRHAGLCTGVLVGHPVHAPPTGLPQVTDLAVATGTPEWWSSGSHQVRAVLHIDVQDLLFSWKAAVQLQMQGADTLEIGALSVQSVAPFDPSLSPEEALVASAAAAASTSIQTQAGASAPHSTAFLPVSRSAVQVSSGHEHSCLLLATGDVQCFGTSGVDAQGTGRGAGKLGHPGLGNVGSDGPLRDAPPVTLPGPAQSITVGPYTSCATLQNGSAFCWGEGQHGLLAANSTEDIGDDEAATSAGPVELPGTVLHVAQGEQHACALLAPGEVWCWGNNTVGQLGVGDTLPRPGALAAVRVPLPELVRDVQSRWQHTCALTQSWQVYCWGKGGLLGHGVQEHVGDNETAAAFGPVPLRGRVVSIAVGVHHSCAVMQWGTIACWGANGAEPAMNTVSGDSPFTPPSAGRLASGSTEDIGDDEPASAMHPFSLLSPAVQVCAGFWHSCALLLDGSVVCWGGDVRGERGGAAGALFSGSSDVIGDDEPVFMHGPVILSDKAVDIACGVFNTFAVLRGGAVQGWGEPRNGMLGAPPFLPSPPGREQEVIRGGILPLPTFGEAAIIPRLALQPVRGGEYTMVSGYSQVVCALATWGGVRCWGLADGGGLGRSFPHASSKVGVDTLGERHTALYLPEPATFVAPGEYHACVITAGGAVRCWGKGDTGRLGTSSSTNKLADEAVLVQLPAPAVSLSAGIASTCAVLSTQQVLCWGDNWHGQLWQPGMSLTGDAGTLVPPVLRAPVVAACTGNGFSCAALANGRVQCAGSGMNGKLGRGTVISDARTDDMDTLNARPYASLARNDAIDVSCGLESACALFANGETQCWGQGGFNFGIYF